MSPSLQHAPTPQFVIAPDNVRLATYDVGDPTAPAVLAVHGFASSSQVNWFDTGWIRELVRAGHRVIALDQRGHGASDKPVDPAAYSMHRLVSDVEVVLDTYLLDEVAFVGYSLGARVGWHASLAEEHRITRSILGGIPDGRTLRRFRVDQARALLEDGVEPEDRITRAYVEMASRTPTNHLPALVALVEGVQQGLQPDPASPPRQPALFATGSEDGILDASVRLAAATPLGEFFEIPGRNHFNAPTARAFRERALAFLASEAGELPRLRRSDLTPGLSAWQAGLAAMLLHGQEAPSGDLDAAKRLLHDNWEAWVRCVEQVRQDAGRTSRSRG